MQTRKVKRTFKIKPMFQKHEGSRTIKRFGLELRYDYSKSISMVFFIIGFMSHYYYVGVFIRKYRKVVKEREL